MKIVRLVVFTFLGILIVLTASIGQFAYRIEETYMGYRFAANELEAILSPLDDPEIHEETVDEFFVTIRRQLDMSIPLELQKPMADAAKTSFSAGWIKDIIRRAHLSFYRVMRGNDDTFSIVVNIGQFKQQLSENVNRSLGSRYSTEVSRELSRIPDSLDLGREIDDQSRDLIVRRLKDLPVYSILLQYALPGVFMLACFSFARPGSALITIGTGLAVSGILVLVFCLTAAQAVGGSAAASITGSLPSAYQWLREGIAESLSKVIRGGSGFAAVILVCGAAVGSAGVFLIRKWGDTFRPVRKPDVNPR